MPPDCRSLCKGSSRYPVYPSAGLPILPSFLSLGRLTRHRPGSHGQCCIICIFTAINGTGVGGLPTPPGGSQYLDDDEALAYLSQHTVYESSRLESMVQEVRAKPGLYLAALGGNQAFADLQKRWLQQPRVTTAMLAATYRCDSRDCTQTIIGMGAVPFALLYDTLGLP